MTIPFAGAVLAGGSSTRMGSDKAFVQVGTQPLIMRSVRALTESGAAPIWVVGGDAPRLSSLRLSVVADMRPGEGPVQAILTALDLAAAPDLVVVLACDLVHPSARSILTMVDAIDESPDAAVVVPVVDGRRQWLHACWRRSRAVRVLTDACERGERSIWGALQDASVIDIASIDPSTVTDADRPEDLPPSTPT